jgi:jumonji domain-containing protein 7
MHPNATQPIYYDTPPSPLEALRMINKSRPAIIKGTYPPRNQLIEGHEILTSKGKEKAWGLPQSYIDIMGDKRVSIAVTEDGLADSVQAINGGKGFVKPLNEEMSLSIFLDRLSTSSHPLVTVVRLIIGDSNSKEIVYLQSQDGNIYRSPPRPDSQPQLEKLQEFIEPDVRWMEEALGTSLSAGLARRY